MFVPPLFGLHPVPVLVVAEVLVVVVLVVVPAEEVEGMHTLLVQVRPDAQSGVELHSPFTATEPG